jgi:hypothetical protein
MIDLNDINYEFNSEVIKLTILQKFSEEDIFRHYLGSFKIGKPFTSPFRVDKCPSFSVFVGRDTGAILFHEMLLKKVGNCFTLVKELYHLNSYRDVYLKICADLGISNIEGMSNDVIQHLKSIEKRKPKPSTLKIGVKYRNWGINDKYFWKSFNISKKTLLEYNVKPV